VTRRNLITLAVVAVLTALCLAAVLVQQFQVPVLGHKGANTTLGMSLGLDLSGGTHLVYQADLTQLQSGQDPTEAMQGAINVITRRVDAYGISEAVVQKQGSDRISVQLPGVRDVDAAVKLIGSTAQLEFKEQQLDGSGSPAVDANGKPLWVPATAVDSTGKTVPLTGQYLNPNAQVVIDQTTNEPRVAIQFNDEGAKLFEQITGRLIGKPLGIFLDTQMISAPTVKARIAGGNAVIENIKLSDAQNLVVLLNAGALPVPLGEPIVREDIDPTLGADSIRKSLVAAVIGLALVIVFMVLYYRVPGVLASCALLIYGILMLGVFKLVPVTLTLAGIAGFILSIGMAVDANVLIFERMKEELRAGKTLAGAIEVGFVRAWPAIRDSNITTFISCVILYVIGSMLAEPRMMGFALTLGIGVALSMFSAITITRGFLRLFVGTNLETKLRLFGVDKPAQAPVNKEQK